MHTTTVMFRRTASGTATAISAAAGSSGSTVPIEVATAIGELGNVGFSERAPLISGATMTSGRLAASQDPSNSRASTAGIASAAATDFDDDDLMNFLTDDANF
jgi:hypothetical protein